GEPASEHGGDRMGFHLGCAKAHRGRAPAGNQRHRREILVARHARLPTAFPPFHETALVSTKDDQLETEVVGEVLTDGKGVAPFDRAEVAVDQKSRTGMTDAVEMLAYRKRRSLTVLATGHADR